MERVTQKVFGNKVKLPLIPQVTGRATLAEFHDVRKWYESCVISLAAYEDTELMPEEITDLIAEVENSHNEIVTLKSLSKSQLQTINALVKKLTTLKKALSDMLFAYQNKDGDYPHRFEIEALAEASILLKQAQEQEGKK